MQGQETDDDMPGLYNVAIKINNGEITNLGEVNWAKEIVQMADLCKLMPYHYPFILWLWGILGLIEDPTKRMDVLGKMQDVAPNCFKTQDEVQEFVRDCDSLVKINTRIREYYLRNDTVKYTLWKGERSCMNGLVGIFSRNFVRPEEMVAIAEEFFCSARDRKKEKLLILLLRADQHIGKLSIDNINDFARSLYVAEGFRQLILSGEEDFYEFPTLDSFDRKLRNACFEVYISMRLQQIRHEFDEDNTLVDDPEDLECLEHLYEEESMVANREITFEDFRGSAAYAAMWYPGRSMVLDIIKVFIEYLGKKITS